MTAETRISVCCLQTFDRHILNVRLIVYTVLLHLHKRLALGSFFRLIEEAGPRLALASKLLQVYAREQDREMLRDFYYSDDRRVDSAILALEEATDMGVRGLCCFLTFGYSHILQDPTSKVTAIKSAQKFFSEDKDHSFEAKVSLPLPTPLARLIQCT